MIHATGRHSSIQFQPEPGHKIHPYLLRQMKVERPNQVWAMETSFCVEALEEALEKYQNPDIFNTDQGSQFTSAAFVGVLLERNIAISMDGRGAWRNNVFVERLWCSVKYEEVYLKAQLRWPRPAQALAATKWRTLSQQFSGAKRPRGAATLRGKKWGQGFGTGFGQM